MNKNVFDGNEAAAYAAYAFSDAFAVYPITPSTSMAEHCEKWVNSGRKNIYGKVPSIYNLQSEKGVGGMLHGLLRSGTLATAFTSSQGLLLMLPVLYKLVGERLPAVIHVASRSLATNALSIYGDHSDVMAVRGSGAVILSSSSVQEALIFSAAAHKLALKLRLPVIHFFDGFDTSHELRDIEVADYEELFSEKDISEAENFRNSALKKDRLYGPAFGPELFFEAQEASNSSYDKVPEKLDEILSDYNKLFGTDLSAINYHGSKSPQNVIISMGSVNGTINEVIDEKRFGNNGAINIHLFRPFPSDRLLKIVEKTTRNIAVLDRVRDIAASAEPLMSDVLNTVYKSGKHIKIIGGRYGLASKDTKPSDIRAVFAEMVKPNPIRRFTIGINDDENHTSLKPLKNEFCNKKKEDKEVKIYACGSEGAVSACRAMSEILANTGFQVQCKSFYDARKSGNLTESEIRFSKSEIKGEYRIEKVDLAVLYSIDYLELALSELEDKGTIIVNTNLEEEDFKICLREKKLPSSYNFYLIDADKFSELIGSAPFINTIMKTAALVALSEDDAKLREIFLSSDSLKLFCRDYGNVNEALLLSLTAGALRSFNGHSGMKIKSPIKKISVSDIIKAGMADGNCPTGLSKNESSRLSLLFPLWDAEKCVQCNACVNQCPHSAIRPFILDKDEVSEGMEVLPSKDKKDKFFRIQISPEHCLGCGNCNAVCTPGALKNLVSKRSDEGKRESEYWKKLKDKENEINDKKEIPANPRAAGFNKPLLEFPGSCAGCAESSYLSLLTRIFGSRLVIANATGCSSIWGGAYPHIPYRCDSEGKAPTFANSLFENNAEFGAGISESLKLREKSDAVTWIVGGDGWAADIDSDGIDYLLNQNLDINILILDNGSYANTGGQYSSLTPKGAKTELRACNSVSPRDIAFQYVVKDNVYVASVCIGANLKQTFDAFREAAAYRGPSVVIAYCPCKLHGIKKNMTGSYFEEQKKAVASGFRFLYRFNPTLEKKFSLDSTPPDKELLKEYLSSEKRFDEGFIAEHFEEIFTDRVRKLNKLKTYSFLC
ncbi:2-oxoacid:acceptor oxidoreductase family protein [Lachnospiraceae bacterium C1.1]|nr:2-oxoacid:acceptor oxidoreductase family protein [Lachnospiraceae bacterium C1.1]